jgi:curved DNA-binding protein CbpA
MESYRVSYYGDIAQFHARELLVSLAAQRETGALLLKRERSLKKIYLHAGRPVYVQSNLAREGFLRFLWQQNRLDAAALETWLADAGHVPHNADIYGFLKEAWGHAPENLRELHREWIRGLLIGAVRAVEGSYVFLFDEKPPAAAIEFLAPFETDALIVAGLRKNTSSTFLREHFRDKLEEAATLRAPAAQVVDRLGLHGAEATIVGRFERGGRFKHLVLACESPTDQTLNVALILETLGLLEFPQKNRRTPKGAPNVGEMGVEGMSFLARLKEKGAELYALPPFEMLDLHRFFDEEELRRGYYTLAQQYHPKEYVEFLPPELRVLSYQIFEKASDIFEALVVWEKKRLADNFAAFRLLESSCSDGAQPTDARSELSFLAGQRFAAAGDWPAARKRFQFAVDACGLQSEYRAWLAWSGVADAPFADVKFALADLRKNVDDDPDSLEGRRLYARALERLDRRDAAHEQYLTGAALAPEDREFQAGKRRTAPVLSARDLAAQEKERAEDVGDERRMRELLQSMERSNYFEILGLPPDAPIAEVRRRYFELAKQFHPDRFKNARSLEFAEKIFVLVNEAYDTLASEKKREQYETALKDAAHKKTLVEREKKLAAERAFQKGKAFLQAHNWAAAVGLFGELAAEKNESAALGKVYYAWSLFNRDFREREDVAREAEKILQEVLKADPGMAEAYVILGKIHRRLNGPARAKQYFEKALDIAPDHVEALREVRLLNQRQGADEPDKERSDSAPDPDDKAQKRRFGSLFGRRKP